MKFPLPRNLFPPLELGAEQEEQFERLANSLIRETLADYDAFSARQGRRVDPARWKQVKRRDEVVIYRERTSGGRSGGVTRSLSSPAIGAASGPSSLAQTIRMPPPPELDPLASPDSFGQDGGSPGSGFLGRTIGFPSSSLAASSSSVGSVRSARSDEPPPSAGRPSASLGRGALPRLLAVGALRGSLDDVMYGVVTPSASAARLRSSYLDDDVADCVVLKQLIAPSASEPFRFLGIKWLAKQSRRAAAALVWPRDFVVLEHSGVMLRPDGARVGFHLMHSVDVPGVRELADRRILRARLSSCYIYEQRHSGRVDVYMAAQVEPRGLVMERLAVRSAARALSSCWQSVECAQSKKLAYFLQHDRPSTAASASTSTAASTSISSAGVPVLEAAAAHSCGVCRNRLGVLTRAATCQLCGQQVCHRCRTVRKLSSQLVDSMVTKTAIVFCAHCVASVNDESSLDVASRETGDAAGRARASSAGSFLSARGSQPSERARRSRADSFSSERDTYASVVLGRQASGDLDSRRSGLSTASSVRSARSVRSAGSARSIGSVRSVRSDYQQPSLARHSSLGPHRRGSAARVKRVSYSLSNAPTAHAGSSDSLSIADLDGSDGEDGDAGDMASGDDPVMLDDSLTKIQHVDFVDMPLLDTRDDATRDDARDATQQGLVRLFDEPGSPPRVYSRSTVIKDAGDVDFEFRMSELAHEDEAPRDGDVPLKAAKAAVSKGEVDLSTTMMDTDSAPAVHAGPAPEDNVEEEEEDEEDEESRRIRAQTPAPGGDGAYKNQLWRQMNELHSVVESTYQVAKANSELAKAATAAADRPRNVRTYSQFNFNVVGLRPTRARTTVATAAGAP